MAAPETFTNLNLTGSLVLNKAQSDPTDDIFKLQGVSWFTRRIISVATITCNVKHYTDENGLERIDIIQVASGGIKTQENRELNGEERHDNHPVFGPIITWCKRVKLDEIANEYQKEDWIETDAEGAFLESHARSDTTKSGKEWVVNQIWGFALVDGERKQVRRLYVTGANGEVITARIIYDYVGPNDSA